MKNSRIVVFSFLEQVCNIVKSLVFVEETGMMEGKWYQELGPRWGLSASRVREALGILG